MHPWLDAVARLPNDQAAFARRASVVLLALQAALCLIAAVNLVMLHGDGAFFVYAIGTGEPWSLKWSTIAARSSTYVLTVLPTWLIADALSLGGRAIAVVNGFLFNAIPVVQFAIVIALGWRRHPGLLLFPLAQYAFATGMGFGFVSEMTLAPGFFWICLFLLLYRPLPVVPFVLSFAGLVFSHELAMPGAVLIAAFAWAQASGTDDAAFKRATRVALAACAAILVAWLTVRLVAGGAGSDDNAKYVLDPRRLLNNPTLWLVTAATIATAAWSWRTKTIASNRTLILAAAAAVLAVAAFAPWLNFADGRYDSARTLMGAAMVIFGAAFAVACLRKPSTPEGQPDSILRSAVPVALTVALAINIAAGAAFLRTWRLARESFEDLAAQEPAGPVFKYITFDQARALMTPRQVRANEQLGFEWSWPYRSLVLADSYAPRYVIYNPHDINGLCKLQRQSARQGGTIPVSAIDNLQTFACAQPAPPPHFGIYARFMKWLHSLFGADASGT
jgi:hypothetical protein